jgi:hypothetical protein
MSTAVPYGGWLWKALGSNQVTRIDPTTVINSKTTMDESIDTPPKEK